MLFRMFKFFTKFVPVTLHIGSAMTAPFEKLLLVLVLAIPFSTLVRAQDGSGEEFSADRPGAIGGSDILPKGRVQLESGSSWERSALEGPWTTTFSVAESLLRVGLSDNAEAHFQGNYLIISNWGGRDRGFDNFSFGTKVKLLDGERFVPDIAINADVIIPGKKGSIFMRQNWGGQMALLFENRITDWFYLCYEGDLIFYGEGTPEFFYGVELFFQPWEQFSVILDQYNYSGSFGTECWSELSLAYLVAPRLQIDLSTDVCLSDPSRYGGLSVGFAWQITKR